jgi:putative membrane-bound dehydrogenase-like protein
MPFVRAILSLLFLGIALPAPAEENAVSARPLEVLFFGDEGPLQPLDRYAMFKEVAGHRGIHLTYGKSPDEFTEENLGRFDAVLVYARHPDINPEQFSALAQFVESGGGLVTVHAGSACFENHEGFGKLVGGRIAIQAEGEVAARVVAPTHPAMVGFTPFETWDGIAQHRQLEDDITVLQRLGDEPWTWVRKQGSGRVFHTAHGLDERCWRHEGFHQMLERGLRWAASDRSPLAALPELSYEVPLLPEHYATRLPVPNVQSPLPPQDSMQRAQVPPGFELSLFAAEPDIENPIAMSWDERDRLWVVEALDYPNHLHSPGNDRLKICEDSDGDGKADRFTIFAEGLSIATSAVHANGGVLVSSGTQILLLRDLDGDDRADSRHVILDGFKVHDTHAGVSNLRYGFDGWIYATIGYAGFEGTVGGEQIAFDTGVFRFLPDGSRLEFLGKTSNNTWGLGLTESFDILGSTANRQGSWQVIGDGGTVHRADRGTRVFPITLDVQGSDGWEAPVELLGNGKIRARSRHFTAAAGHGVYTDRRFPKEWWNQTAFVCEPTGHLVAIARLRNEDADFIAEFDGNNLYASSDAWSAPVAAETGPDGAVWIADWYNIIIQHNRPGAPFEQTQVERGPGAAYITPLREHRMGRIYRIVPKNSSNPEPPVDDLVARLADPSLVRRLHAQRQIVEKSQKAWVPALKAAAKEMHGQHAIYTLASLGEADSELLTPLLSHPSSTHRRAALASWPVELPCPFNPLLESDPFVLREWLLLAARQPADDALGRKLREWHREHASLRRGVVLDRCFAAAAARHATGFLLASLETPPDPSVLNERIYPAAIRAFAASRSPRIIALLEHDDSPLATALKDSLTTPMTAKRHSLPMAQLAHGEAIYARTCAACHQSSGVGLDGAFPPLDGSTIATSHPALAIRIVLHGMTGPVEIAGKQVVDSVMPPLANLTDSEIADVLSFVRHAWSNDAAPVSEDEVAKVRAANRDRRTPWKAEELQRDSP